MRLTPGSISKKVRILAEFRIAGEGTGPEANDGDFVQTRVGLESRRTRCRWGRAWIIGQGHFSQVGVEALLAVNGVAVNKPTEAVDLGDAVDAKEVRSR